MLLNYEYNHVIWYFNFSRFKSLSEKDTDFEKRWKHLGELPVETEFNWDEEIEPEPPVKAVNTK